MNPFSQFSQNLNVVIYINFALLKSAYSLMFAQHHS